MALWRARDKPPVELVVANLETTVLRNSRDRLRGISQHGTRHLQAVLFEISRERFKFCVNRKN